MPLLLPSRASVSIERHRWHGLPSAPACTFIELTAPSVSLSFSPDHLDELYAVIGADENTASVTLDQMEQNFTSAGFVSYAAIQLVVIVACAATITLSVTVSVTITATLENNFIF